MRKVFLLVDDIDRDSNSAGSYPFDANGKSYGCAIFDVSELGMFDTDDEFVDAVLMLDPVDRIYAPTESETLVQAQQIALKNSWQIVPV